MSPQKSVDGLKQLPQLLNRLGSVIIEEHESQNVACGLLDVDSQDEDIVPEDQEADSIDREIVVDLAASCPWTDEQSCIETLFHARWPDGFRCMHCNHGDSYLIETRRLPLYDCKRCRKQFSLTSGTVFHRSSTPLLKWFKAIFLHSREQGISAVRLARAIGVTYKTAWLLGHKLRKIMRIEGDKQQLGGDVFVTDLIFYHQRFIRSSEWQPEEQCVLVGGEFDSEKNVEQVQIIHVPREQAPLRDFVPDYTPFQNNVVAPESRSTMVYKSRYRQHRYHPRQWPRPRGEEAERIEREDRTCLKQLRAIVDRAKNWILWTFCGIGPKHLQAYISQFCYARNRLGQETTIPLLQQCTENKAITYPELTGAFSDQSHVSHRQGKPKEQPPARKWRGQ